MTIRYRQNMPYPLGVSRNCGSKTLAIAVAMCCVLATGTALAGGGDEDDDQARFCSATTSAQFTACASEVKDDFFVAKAKCINVSAEKKRKECFLEAKVAREEGKQLCGAQRTARLAICGELGPSSS